MSELSIQDDYAEMFRGMDVDLSPESDFGILDQVLSQDLVWPDVIGVDVPMDGESEPPPQPELEPQQQPLPEIPSQDNEYHAEVAADVQVLAEVINEPPAFMQPIGDEPQIIREVRRFGPQRVRRQRPHRHIARRRSYRPPEYRYDPYATEHPYDEHHSMVIAFGNAILVPHDAKLRYRQWKRFLPLGRVLLKWGENYDFISARLTVNHGPY